MPMRLSSSKLLLDANSTYHCQPTASWWPERGQATAVATHTSPKPADQTNALDWRVTAAAIVPSSPPISATNITESTRVGTAFGSAGSGAMAVMATNSSGHPAPTTHAHARGRGCGWRSIRGTVRGNRRSSLARRPSMSTSQLGEPPHSRAEDRF